MNWIVRLGEWFESRKKITQEDHERSLRNLNYEIKKVVDEMRAGDLKIEAHLHLVESLCCTKDLVIAVGDRISKIEESRDVPQIIAKEFALLNARIDRLELLTGLKREPEAARVPGAARIA